MKELIRLLIVDDDPLVCESLKLLLDKNEDMDVLDTAENGFDAIEKIKNRETNHLELPNIVLMDIQMPVMDGIEATGLIKRDFPAIRVMMLTTFKDEHNIRKALRSHAEGYLVKSTNVLSMAEKIRTLFTGTAVLDKIALEKLTKPNNMNMNSLTPREADIVRFVGEGFSNKEIAQQLFISEGTVRNNLSVVLEKLDIRDRTQLAILYLKNS